MLSRSLGRMLIAVLSAWTLNAGAAAPVWLADPGHLYRVEADRVALADVLPLEGAVAVAASSKGQAWVLMADRLQRWDISAKGDTQLSVSVPLGQLGAQASKHLRVDPSDGSAWLADGSHLWHVGPSGELIGKHLAAEAVVDFVIGWDHSLWLLGATELRHIERLEAGGRTLDSFLLDAHPERSTRIALDPVHKGVWLGGARWLSRIDLSSTRPRIDRPLPARSLGFTVDPQSGTLWVLTPAALIAHGHEGERQKSILLAGSRIAEPRAFTVDPGGRYLWVSHRRGLSRIDSTDAAAIALPMPRAEGLLRTVAAAPFLVQPTLALKSPALQQQVLPSTEFRFEVGADCNHGDCALPAEYYSSMDVRAKLNGESLGVLNVDSATRAAGAVAGDFPRDGSKVRLDASAVDSFGSHAADIRLDFIPAVRSGNGQASQPVRVPMPGATSKTVSQPVVANTAVVPPATSASAAAFVNASPADAVAAGQNALTRLPLTFEANRGQQPSEVDYFSRGRGYQLFLTQGEAVLRINKRRALRDRKTGASAAEAVSADVVRMRFPGSKRRPQVVPEEVLQTKSHYLNGSDRSSWRLDVPHYGKVRYLDVYPGIDQVYYGKEGQLEYDWIVKPGADPRQIEKEFSGAKGISFNAQGDVLVEVESGRLIQHKPIAYQEVGGERRPVDARYVVLGGNTVGIALGDYDRARVLVIDPVLSYATYLGGKGDDMANAVAVDADGNVYVAGRTWSSDFPKTGTENSAGMLFVSKLNPSGTQLIYSAFFPASSASSGRYLSAAINAMAVDGQGNVYIAGVAMAGFPTTAGSAQPKPGQYSWLPGCTNCNAATRPRPNGFIAKLNPQGNGLVYSTFLDGGLDGINGYSGDYGLWTQVRSIALGSDGSVFAVGETDSPHFPTTAGAYRQAKPSSYKNVVNAFVTKLNPAGSAWTYSTYLGGSGPHPDDQGLRTSSPTGDATAGDVAWSVAVDASGNAYVGGSTLSPDFPVTADALQGSRKGSMDGFITKLSADGTTLLYSSLLGGGEAYSTAYAATKQKRKSGVDIITGIRLDAANRVYVTGATNSLDFPKAGVASSLGTANGTLYTVDGIDIRLTNAFVAKLDLTNAGAGQLVYSRYLGGGGCMSGNCLVTTTLYADKATGIAVDADGNATIVGFTGSVDFPTNSQFAALGAILKRAPFVAQFDPNGVVRYASPVATPTQSDYESAEDPWLRFNYQEGQSLASSIALDAGGSAYVTGGIVDDTMNTTFGAFMPNEATDPNPNNAYAWGGRDAFVIKVAPSGSATINIATSPNPSPVYERITISVNVSGGVSFRSGTWSWCDGNVCQDMPRPLSTVQTWLTVGKHNLTARYSGDGLNPPLVSPVRVHTVFPAQMPSPNDTAQATAITVTATPATAAVGQEVTLIAQVTSPYGGCPVKGPIFFSDGAQTLTVVQGNPQGTFAVVKFTSAGVHNVVASYAGDGGCKSSTSAPVQVTVDESNPGVVLVSPISGSRFPLRATVPMMAYATAKPGRKITDVRFYVDGLYVSGANAAPYRASWNDPVNTLPGTYTITAVATDETGAKATSAPVTVQFSTPPALGHSVTYLHNDVTGSAVAATDESGQVLWKETYRPYGERVLNQTAAANNRQFFHGKPYDTASGLQYFGARYFDPAVGRFMGPDPKGYTEGDWHSINRYAFANNNPYHYTDPDGNSPLDLIFLAADVAKLGYAVYTGDSAAIKEGLIDVAISTAGVLVPVPGMGQAAKAARAAEKVAEVSRAAGHMSEQARMVEKAVKACACCFVAGTPVLTDKGMVPIEQIEIGTVVQSRDEITGRTALKPVTGLIRNQGRDLYSLVLVGHAGEVTRLEVSDNHPFWVVGSGWVNSARLHRGMRVETFGGRAAAIANLQSLGRTEKTYNLAVADYQTFFVGRSQAYVHNTCACGLVGKEAASKTDRLKAHILNGELEAARKEAAGQVVARKTSGKPWDHVHELRDAQRGLLNRIDSIKRKLGRDDISGSERGALQRELGEASKLLDKTEGYLPR